jgi:hypothetical protein
VQDINIGKTDIPTRLAKGDLLGWFNMGSSVIILLPPGSCEIAAGAGKKVRMGQAIGRLIRELP